MSTRRQWICGTIDSPDGTRQQGGPTELLTLGVADLGKIWKGRQALTVHFLRGEPALHARVLSAARQWLQPDIRFDIVAAPAGDRGDLRVDFNPHTGSWSYIGTDCSLIRPADPTMNLGWAALDTPEDDFNSVVVHEFGHALGLLHEHNHPQVAIPWNKIAVYDELGGDPNYWDKKKVDDNVFAKFAPSTVVTPFDKDSVMMYTVPSTWTTDGSSYMPSPLPSPGDRATFRKLYG